MYDVYIYIYIVDIVDANTEVASSDDVALVEVLDPFGRGLDVHFYFLYVARRCLHKSSLSSREEKSQCEKWE